ncbi:MAG: CBS domain-containing protein [Planctomycetota bacterium]|nr:CBS domain-containing protein [Planctomycetota bacterium]
MAEVRAVLVHYFMTRSVLTVAESTTCREALRLLQSKNIRRAPVLRDGTIVGLVSERDLLRVLPGTIAQLDTRAGAEGERTPVARVMATQVVTIDEDASIEEAARRMLFHRIGGMPVLSKGALVGIVTESDIFRAFAAALSPDGVLRISVGFLETASVSPDFAKIVASVGARLCGLVSYERPAGQRLAVLRVKQGDRDELIEALHEAGCNVLEASDARPKAAHPHAA